MQKRGDSMKTAELQELLLSTMPQWHYWIDKPFKTLLDDSMSLGMYYCIQILIEHGDSLTMSELARFTHSPKQQITKTVDRLTECNFAERISDPSDRRIVRLKLTQQGKDYISHFLTEKAGYYQNLFDEMPSEEREAFYQALRTLHECFCNMHKRKLDMNQSGKNQTKS